MGLIKATLVYPQTDQFVVERSICWGIGVNWWEGCVFYTGQVSLIREVPFGGYRVYLAINPDFWFNTSSAWKITELIDTLYAMPPSSSEPVFAGEVRVSFQYFASLLSYALFIQFIPNGNVGTWWAMPRGTENAGLPTPIAPIPAAFRTVPSPPGVPFPLPSC